MSDYLCVDGPLRGHVLASDEVPAGDGTVTVELVGIGRLTVEEPRHPDARYAVEAEPVGEVPGTLRFVAAHGLYRKPALPVRLRARAGA